MLMSQHTLTEDEASDLLRAASQHGKRTLREVALDVIDTGRLDAVLVPAATWAGQP